LSRRRYFHLFSRRDCFNPGVRHLVSLSRCPGSAWSSFRRWDQARTSVTRFAQATIFQFREVSQVLSGLGRSLSIPHRTERRGREVSRCSVPRIPGWTGRDSIAGRGAPSSAGPGSRRPFCRVPADRDSRSQQRVPQKGQERLQTWGRVEVHRDDLSSWMVTRAPPVCMSDDDTPDLRLEDGPACDAVRA